MSKDDRSPRKAKKGKPRQKSASKEKETRCENENAQTDPRVNITAESEEVGAKVEDSGSENGKAKKMKKSKKRKSLDALDVTEADKAESKEIDNTQTPVKKKKKRQVNEKTDKASDESGDNPGNDSEVKKSPKSKKKKKKKLKEQDNEQSTPDPEQKGDKLASEYLKQWSDDRKNWKFQKVRQVWLLKHMYKQDQVTDDDFEILLLYLDGLKGKSREVTVKQAEDIMEKDEDSEETEHMKTERARKIVQLLS